MIQKSIRRLLFNLNSFQFGIIKQFKLPDLGEKIKEATIKQWHVKVGDKIEEFQPVADVATDKMFTQIPSSYSGIVHKIFHQVEQECQVGELFLEVEIEDSNNKIIQQSESDDEEQFQQNNKNNQNKNNPQQSIINDSNKVSGILATPSVRRQAKDLGVDINLIKGTGQPDGRILAIDIDNFINLSKNKIEQKVEPIKQVPEEQINKIISNTNININEATQNYQEIKMSNFQKGMQKSMTKSSEIPHLYLMDEFDITSIGLIREELKKQLGVPITFFSLFVKAFSLALLKYPIMNSHYDPNKPFEYRTYKSHNISLALDTPQGLIVPNIKDCQNLSILDIHNELDRLKNLGNKGTLLQQDIIDGTICLSNIGTIGGTYTGPLILPPQVCIVGLGRARTLPRYDHKMNLVPKKIMNVSFGCDHRIVDGATVTRFSNQWKNYIENPYSMLSNLS